MINSDPMCIFVPNRYLDPRNHLAFRLLFGVEKHKHITIDFLNAVLCLGDGHKISSLEFLDIKQTPEIDARKESSIDVIVKDQAGIKYVVEMHAANVEYFEKKAQYYAAKTYCAHFGEGKKFSDLTKVVFLAITSYVFFPKKESYKSDHVILHNNTLSQENDLKNFYFTFVELPKFTKPLEELQTVEDKWCYFLKHADEGDNIREALCHHPEIKEAYEILNRYNWTDNQLFWYEKFMMDDMDAQGVIVAARNEGRLRSQTSLSQ